VSKLETDLAVLKWMLGFSLAVQIATLLLSWQILLKLPG
jgi:hypothetical protein